MLRRSASRSPPAPRSARTACHAPRHALATAAATAESRPPVGPSTGRGTASCPAILPDESHRAVACFAVDNGIQAGVSFCLINPTAYVYANVSSCSARGGQCECVSQACVTGHGGGMAVDGGYCPDDVPQCCFETQVDCNSAAICINTERSPTCADAETGCKSTPIVPLLQHGYAAVRWGPRDR